MDAERTFIMVKPDGVQRGIMGEVLKRYEQKGLKLVAAKFHQPIAEVVANHYSEHREKPFYGSLCDFIAQGPVFCMIWEGPEAVKIGRKLVGVTSPMESAPGTIRGDFGVVTHKNLVHASSSVEDAKRECSLWFKPEEIVSWDRAVAGWIV
ncbi:nucleoside diphosphate kinase family protein, putative [Babesia bigemina]|uniref:nucleoside-diphosphate kinase n=1 Tax=Babesia bigemina TaxID=5866 RepID=A0A061DAL7_BABBI|nr:nucleoside diphosphate kinase family protein, putative [Babesia bigemina]CDR97027.1 nucleoside diphosphate kinase family protein, putative [Babesia bigemina]|eukprot:XP_012769213.1 nucleoside diphosphate kinase family protein, putative [Babesia bigemina]